MDYNLYICILTYNRDQGLTDLLVSLSRLRRCDTINFECIVVDNYARTDAKSICLDLSKKLGVKVHYAVEKRKGLVYARNTALREVPVSAEFIAFLDDDEIVDSEWLKSMFSCFRKYNADVVNGPVRNIYPERAPPWIIEQKYLVRQEKETGKLCLSANTGNVIFKREILDSLDYWFDQKYNLSGGEDTDFFSRVAGLGYDIVYASNAIVHEKVNIDRCNKTWLLKRNLRCGNCYGRIEIDRKGRCSAVPSICSRAARLVGGWCLGRANHTPQRFRLLALGLRCSTAIGALLALISVDVGEYK